MDGDWESFKQKFEATADLNGLNEAVMAGQLFAEGKVKWPWQETYNEGSNEIIEGEIYSGKSEEIERDDKYGKLSNELMERASEQSHRLASMLTLSLLDSTGIQKSIVADRLRYEKDGVRAWAELIQHFEMSSKDLRIENLTQQWDDAVLKAGEHPDQLWTKLMSINQNLKKLGEQFKESHFTRRFIAGVKAQPGNPYKQILTMYKGSVITGSPLSMNQIRELLSETYVDEKVAAGQEYENMKGFIAFKVCEVCKKKGHTKEDCWVIHPEKKPNRENKNEKHMKNSKQSRITCWKCGKPGHSKRECRTRSNPPQGIVAAAAGPLIATHKPIYIDSACSCHLMADLEYLKPNTITETVESITAVGSQKLSLRRKGTAEIHTMNGMLTLTDAHCAYGLDFSLVSVPQLVKRGIRVHLSDNKAYIEKNKARINLQRIGGLWALPMESENKVAALATRRKNHTSAETWHKRLGHVSADKMRQLASDKLVPVEATRYNAGLCEICLTTRPMRRPVSNIAAESGDATVQVDFMPLGQNKKGWKGEIGVYVYSCRKSKILKAYPVKNATAGSAVETLKDYLVHVRPYIKQIATCIQSDAGTQFTSREWISTCASNGLKARTCPVDHQEMNGQVERMIGILATKMRSLLKTMRVPKQYWPLAVIAAAHIINRTPSTALGGKTTIEAGTGVKPDLSKMKVFGCRACVQIPKSQRKGKLNPTAWQGMMVGYSTNSPEWIILDERTNTLRKAYSVVFLEEVRGINAECGNEEKMKQQEVMTSYEPNCCHDERSDSELKENGVGLTPHKINEKDSNRHDDESKSEPSEDAGKDPPSDDSSLDERSDPSWEGNDDGETNDQTDLCPRRTARTRRQFNPNYMPSGTLEMERLTEQIENESTSSDDDDYAQNLGIDKPKVLANPSLRPVQQAEENDLGLCMAMTMTEEVPRSWKQAVHVSHWKEAMDKEIKELEAKEAWVLVDRTDDMKVLPGVWNYRTKRDENGSIAKYKARWCVNGSGDKFTWPPEAIYSPVAELSTVRLVFAAAAATGQAVLQADFPNAYLNADMTENVYVCQPYGIYNGTSSKKICLLKKALYGCPISGKRWHDDVASKIKTLRYSRSVIDHCLFIRDAGGYTDLLVIYVDDLLVTSTGGRERAERQLNELQNLYDIKRLGTATHMPGIGVHQGDGYVTLEQRAYTNKILGEMEYDCIKPRGTPWDHQYVGKEDLLDVTYTVLFRRVLGQLMYLANCTRPDISLAVGRLASHMKDPSKRDWERIKRLLRYVNGTKNYGLTYRSQYKGPTLRTYVDAAYGVDPKRGRSITGYVVHMGGTPILWRSHLQATVADSPNAAEYIALYEAAVVTVGLQNLAVGLGVTVDRPPVLYKDNDGARRLAKSGMGQKKARHLMMKLHYVQDLCEKGTIDVVRLAGKEQPADLLTKGSHTVKAFTYLREKLGVVICSHSQ